MRKKVLNHAEKKQTTKKDKKAEKVKTRKRANQSQRRSYWKAVLSLKTASQEKAHMPKRVPELE